MSVLAVCDRPQYAIRIGGYAIFVSMTTVAIVAGLHQDKDFKVAGFQIRSCKSWGAAALTFALATIAPARSPQAASPPAVELPAIPSNFDIQSELVPAWGNGAIPASARPDVVGAFRFICNAGQISYDDPIVYPGQPGKSHLHQFFGNTSADANSTYASLRSTGDSTCNSPLNRSGYWMPAMMNGQGKVLRPDFVSIYYKRRPASDPSCRKQGAGCVNIPRGLRFIFGYDMLNHAAPATGGGYFSCDGPGAIPGHYRNIVTAARNCPVGNKLGAIINAPSCWDGKNLDSADHRSHVAYPSYGDWGYEKCPSTHPMVIPTFTLGAWYTTDDSLDRSGIWSGSHRTWHLSSDAMAGMPMAVPGSTFHTDWFGAWDDTILKMWSDNCIDKLLSCSGGDLGNGKQMKMFAGFSWVAEPRIVDPPPLPEVAGANTVHQH